MATPSKCFLLWLLFAAGAFVGLMVGMHIGNTLSQKELRQWSDNDETRPGGEQSRHISEAQDVRLQPTLAHEIKPVVVKETPTPAATITGRAKTTKTTRTPTTTTTATTTTKTTTTTSAASTKKLNPSLPRPPTTRAPFPYSSPWMHPREVQAINAVIYNSSKPLQYLEWGTGGSTVTWATKTAHAHCIEHSQGWCSIMKAELERTKTKNVDFHCVPVDKGYKGWGGGYEEGTYDQFEAYINKIHTLKISPHSLDVILVDGRARFCCALTAIPYLKPDGILIVHDFTSRPYYRGILQYFDIVKAELSLVLLRPKPDAVRKPPTAKLIREIAPTKFS